MTIFERVAVVQSWARVVSGARVALLSGLGVIAACTSSPPPEKVEEPSRHLGTASAAYIDPNACSMAPQLVTWDGTTAAPILTVDSLHVSSEVQQQRGSARTNVARCNGKWYWEIEIDAPAGATLSYPILGVGDASAALTGLYVGNTADGWGYYPANAEKYNDSQSGNYGPYGLAAGVGDVIGVALDIDDHTLTFYKNGVSLGVAFTNLPSGAPLYPMVGTAELYFASTARFAPPFSHAPPDGYSPFGGIPPAEIWSIDFTGFPAGNVHSLTSRAPQLSLQRASSATVQTSPSTIDTTPGVDEARIGNTGAAQGLVIEEARTNAFTNSRNPGLAGSTAFGYTVVQPGVTVTTGYAPGPDGTQNGSRFQIPITGPAAAVAQWLNPDPGSFAVGDTLTFSEWVRPTSAATGSAGPIVQWGVCDNAYHSSWAVSLPGYNGTYLPTTGTQWGRSIVQPLQIAKSAPTVLAPAFQDWGWCGDLWAGVNSNVYAVDQVVDLVQAEKGLFATEPIITDASRATRAGDHLQITNGAGAVDGGQLSLYLKMYPKGDALACPATVVPTGALVKACAPGYSAPAYLFYIDNNNYALFNAQDQSVTLAVAGATASSALGPIWGSAGPPGGAADAGAAHGGAATSLFQAGQSLEWFIRAGAGAGLVQYRINGGRIATLLDSPLSGSVAPTAGIDLLSSGTTNQFSAWLAGAAVYLKGRGGLTSQSTCGFDPGEGSIEFTTSGGGLTLQATSGPGATAGSMTTSWTIFSGSSMVMQGSQTDAQGVTTTVRNFGAGFTGLTQSTTSFDGKTLTGSVNGRALVPETFGATGTFPAFADNGPAPQVTVDPSLGGKVSALVGHIRADAYALCPTVAAPAVSSLLGVLAMAGSGASPLGGAAPITAARRQQASTLHGPAPAAALHHHASTPPSKLGQNAR